MGEAIARPRTRRLDRLTWAASTAFTLDLIKSYRVDKPITRLRFRFAGNIVTGGAITNTTEASIQLLFARLQVYGHHETLGLVQILDMAGPALANLWHQMNDLIGKEQDFADPSPTASNANFRREFTLVFDSPAHIGGFFSYHDMREFSSFQVQFTTGALTDYAATNVTSATGTIAVEIDEVPEGLDYGRPHFVPGFKEIQNVIGAVTSTDIPFNGIRTGGFIPIASFTPHDDSATGASIINIAGLVRRISLFDGGEKAYIDKQEWDTLALQTEQFFPKGFTTTRRIGPVTVLLDKNRDLAGLVDNRAIDLNIIADTSSTTQTGTTAIIAAAGDRLDASLVVWKPNESMKKLMREHGIAA